MSHALIVDDNVKNVNILARLLSEQGISSTLVMNPRLIDSMLETITSVDVIFLDLEMPGLNGYDVLQHVKMDARFQQVPVVAYTVHISEINEARRRGFDGFIGKPLDPDKFPDQLNRILRGEAVWDTM